MRHVMAGRFDNLEAVISAAEDVAIFQIGYGVVALHGGKVGRKYARGLTLRFGAQGHCVDDGQKRAALQVVHNARLFERMHMGVHAHARTPNAIEVAHMIGVAVRCKHIDVLKVEAEIVEGQAQCLLALYAVEADVHKRGMVFIEDQIGIQLLERVFGQRHFDKENAWCDFA